MMEHTSIGTQIQDLVNMIGAARSITFFSQNKRAGGGGFSLSGGTETTVGSDKVLTFETNGLINKMIFFFIHIKFPHKCFMVKVIHHVVIK